LANVILIFGIIGEAFLWARSQSSQLCSDTTGAHLAPFDRGKLWNKHLSAGASKSTFANMVLKLALENQNIGDKQISKPWWLTVCVEYESTVPYLQICSV